MESTQSRLSFEPSSPKTTGLATECESTIVLREEKQVIQCTGTDAQLSFPIYSNDVSIEASEPSSVGQESGSNKVKVSQISKFDWEQRYYRGNLVSCSNRYIAYVIRAKANTDDHVRVINHHTCARVLLKGFSGKVVDLAFASIDSKLLACIDGEGSLFIFEITEDASTIKHKLLLHLKSFKGIKSEDYRIFWAPNICPSEEQDHLIAMSSDCKAEVFAINRIIAKFGEGTHNVDDIDEGVVKVEDGHTKVITGLALSPDLQVLATSSIDGDVKFWGLDFESNEAPRCLHEWEPHGGDPVTSIFFCDNLLPSDNRSPFWRFLITGTRQNSILKIWCAVSWKCLQTISFEKCSSSNSNDYNRSPFLKAALDISASYLVLSDINRQVLYIFHLHQNAELGHAYVTSVSEFILTQPLLSFCIYSAKTKKSSRSTSSGDEEVGLVNGVDHNKMNGEDSDENEKETAEKSIALFLTLFGIHTRSLQKLSVRFKPEFSIPMPTPSISTAASSQDDLLSIRDGLSDVDPNEIFTPRSNRESIPISQNSTFSRESTPESQEEGISPLAQSVSSSVSSLTAVTALKSLPDTPRDADDEKLQISPDGDRTLMSINTEEANSINASSSIMSSVMLDSAVLEAADLQRTSMSINERVVGEVLSSPHGSVSSDSSRYKIKSGVVQDEADAGAKLSSAILNSQGGSMERETVYDEKPPSDMQGLTEAFRKQQILLLNQQKELGEVKEMLKALMQFSLSQQQNHMKVSEEAETDRDDAKVQMQLLQKSTTSHISKAVKEMQKSCNQTLEQFSSNLAQMLAQREQNTVNMITQACSSAVSMKMEKVVKTEVKQAVLPALEKIVNKQLEVVNSQVAQRISIWERTLREESGEVMRSKPVAEAIGYAAASVLEGTMPNSYREAFQKVLLPAFEKASISMFMQINQTFQQGTKQYLEKLESHLDVKRQKQQEARDPLLHSLQELVDSFHSTADILTNSVEKNLGALMKKELHDHNDKFQSRIGQMIENEIKPIIASAVEKCLEESMDRLRNGMDTFSASTVYNGDEVDSRTKQEIMMQYAQEGNYNKAFETALTAADLALVMELCKTVDPIKVFSSKHTLPQAIVLSLIQQLSNDLATDMDLKTTYLTESITALDPKDEVTSRHLPDVLELLIQQLNATIESFLETDPGSQQIKPLKMLLMAANYLRHNR